MVWASQSHPLSTLAMESPFLLSQAHQAPIACSLRMIELSVGLNLKKSSCLQAVSSLWMAVVTPGVQTAWSQAATAALQTASWTSN